MHTRHATSVGAITLIMTLLGWSSVPLFLRHFSDSIDAWTSNGWRYGFSALVWLPVLIVAILRTRLPRGLWKAALVPSIVNAAGQVCFTWAHYRIDPALLTFGLRTQLIFVAVGAWILFPRERAVIRTPGYLIGGCALLAGSAAVLFLDHPPAEITDGGHSHILENVRMSSPADELPEVAQRSHILENVRMSSDGVETTAPDQLMSSGPAREASPDTPLPAGHSPAARPRGTPAAHVQGVLLAIASGLLFACYGLAVRKFMAGVNSVHAFAAICQYTALAMVALMLALGERAGLTVLNLSTSQIVLLLLSAIIGIAIGHVFYYISIARLGVAVTAGVLQLQPFFVGLFSLTLFGERLSGWQWIGGSMAVLGAMAMLWMQWRVTKAATAAQARAIEEPVAIAEGESGA